MNRVEAVRAEVRFDNDVNNISHSGSSEFEIGYTLYIKSALTINDHFGRNTTFSGISQRKIDCGLIPVG